MFSFLVNILNLDLLKVKIRIKSKNCWLNNILYFYRKSSTFNYSNDKVIKYVWYIVFKINIKMCKNKLKLFCYISKIW